MGNYLAAVDIGGTNVRTSVSNRQGILAKRIESTLKVGDESALPRQVVRMIDSVCSEIGIEVGEVEAVGVSTCSPFRRVDGKLGIVSPNICGGLGWSPVPPHNDWQFVPLEAFLIKTFPLVEIGNDCATAAVAEHTFGAGRDVANMIYVTWSTGIGAGAIVDGCLLGGKHQNAMHLGHIPLHLDGDSGYVDGWQSVSTLENNVAGPAIALDFDGSTKTIEAFRQYRAGNPKAVAVVERAARIFARSLVTATMLLDTRFFVLGGSVSNDWDVLEPLLSREFHAANPYFVGEVELKRSVLAKHLSALAGLSIIMPKEWVSEWVRLRPWEDSPPS